MCICYTFFNGFMTIMVYMYPWFFLGRYSAYFLIFHQCKQRFLFLFLVVCQIYSSGWCPNWNNQNAGENIKYIIWCIKRNPQRLETKWKRKIAEVVLSEVFYWIQENLSSCLVGCRIQEVKLNVHTRSGSQQKIPNRKLTSQGLHFQRNGINRK